ncbi:MAG: YkgJ family cysteine cluster protein [Desulfobulbales bacterium]|nr:YkgJ family cysteine cluster protein [Desulfobulbales bacterium]
MAENKKECDRCGTCCSKGGPALHNEDFKLLKNRLVRPEHLITIRKGEPVLALFADTPAPAQSEIIKIKGRGSEWTCLFFAEPEAECTIYGLRPLECSILKCWDTADLENAAGKNLLSRYDILTPQQEPILGFIKKHDAECPLENLTQLLSAISRKNSQQRALNSLTEMVNNDLAIRSQACAELNLSLDIELFIFGRPLFTILTQYGIKVHEQKGFYRLSISRPLPQTLS